MKLPRLNLTSVLLAFCCLSAPVFAAVDGGGDGVSVPEPASIMAALLAGGLIVGGMVLQKRLRK